MRHTSLKEMSVFLECGEAHWVTVPALLTALRSESSVDVQVPSLQAPGTTLPLYLPFVTLLHRAGFVDQITALTSTLEAQVGKRIAVTDASPQSAVACATIADAGVERPAAAAVAAVSAGGAAVHEESYGCKFCRFVLFYARDVKGHTEGVGQAAFHPARRTAGARPPDCTNIFTEVLPWMRQGEDKLAEVEGKIVCPNVKCGARLGSYNWSGTQCSCSSPLLHIF
jgi:hypothetical protein